MTKELTPPPHKKKEEFLHFCVLWAFVCVCDESSGKDCKVVHSLCCSTHAWSTNVCIQGRKGCWRCQAVPFDYVVRVLGDAAVSCSNLLCWLLFCVLIQCSQLISNVSLQHDLVLWIVDFLTDVNKCLWTCCPLHELSLVLDPPGGCSFFPPLPSVYRWLLQ